jgi:hypothetical protein
MTIPRTLIAFFGVLVLGGSSALVRAETHFVAFDANMRFAFPPNPILPAELSFKATVVPAEGQEFPRIPGVQLRFCIPSAAIWCDDVPYSDSNVPTIPFLSNNVTIELPADECLVPARGGGWMVGAICDAKLYGMGADGVWYNLTQYLVEVKGKIVPLTTDTNIVYVVTLKVSFAQGIFPPNLCRAATEFYIGDQVGRFLNAACEGSGAAE